MKKDQRNKMIAGGAVAVAVAVALALVYGKKNGKKNGKKKEIVVPDDLATEDEKRNFIRQRMLMGDNDSSPVFIPVLYSILVLFVVGGIVAFIAVQVPERRRKQN